MGEPKDESMIAFRKEKAMERYSNIYLCSLDNDTCTMTGLHGPTLIEVHGFVNAYVFKDGKVQLGISGHCLDING